LDLKTFRESAISPSMLRSFHFCEAQPIVCKQARRQNLRVRGMKMGTSRHTNLSVQTNLLDLEPVDVFTVDEDPGFLEDSIRGALRKRRVLANTFRVRTFASIVPELVPGRGLLGYPYAVDCTGGEPVGIFKIRTNAAMTDSLGHYLVYRPKLNYQRSAIFLRWYEYGGPRMPTWYTIYSKGSR
jgi:hypothetical protein